jgi:hypothetical protein
MIEVLKAFYPIHYNFAAVSLLLLLLIIFLLTKKNYKWSLIFFAVVIAFNIFIYKKTVDKVWIVPSVEDPEVKYTFSVAGDWTIKDEKGVIHHYCWVEKWLDDFGGFDFVDRLWGTSEAKKMKKTSEDRMNQ